MTAEYTSIVRLSGGSPTSIDDLENFKFLAAQLCTTSRLLQQILDQLRLSIDKTTIDISQILSCTVTFLSPESHQILTNKVACAQQLNAEGHELSDILNPLVQRCNNLSDRIARVGGQYSQAESTISRLFSQLAGPASSSLLGFAGSLGIGALMSNSGNEEASRYLKRTDFLQNKAITALGGGRKGGNPLLTLLYPFIKSAEYKYQGDTLEVTEQHISNDFLQPSVTINQALHNLDRLADENNGVTPYNTVAVQKYIDSDENTKWLVLIPGTTTHPDAATGWGQNLELMSSSNDIRRSAASAQLIYEAMSRSGIKPGEDVTMIGHSQGGIVAAAIASDDKNPYSINHIVTAGSPIAQYQIPDNTWITSIENEGELVSNLDGSDNPTNRQNWLTVRGNIARRDGIGAPVENHPIHEELTHGLNYQQASWNDALALDTQSVRNHNDHFTEAISGQLVGTQYFTGRLPYNSELQSHRYGDND